VKKVLITGGGGFVGKALVHQLRVRDIQCLVVGRHLYPELETLGVTCRQGDIRDRGFMRECCRGMDTVFHVAAMAGIVGEVAGLLCHQCPRH